MKTFFNGGLDRFLMGFAVLLAALPMLAIAAGSSI
jgi:hypothetical protein